MHAFLLPTFKANSVKKCPFINFISFINLFIYKRFLALFQLRRLTPIDLPVLWRLLGTSKPSRLGK